MKIKANFHLHSKEDPLDNLSYSIFQAIDESKKKNYNVLAMTLHTKFGANEEIIKYAQNKNILLISGIEAIIEGCDVLILNCDKESEKIKSFEELKKYKKEKPEIFIIAPHPFVYDIGHRSLFSKCEKNIDLFDAIEPTIFSNKIFNFNKKAKNLAEKYSKPLIATSDLHQLKDIDRGFIEIETENKTPEKIFEAIKNRNYKNFIKPMEPFSMAEIKIKGYLKMM